MRSHEENLVIQERACHALQLLAKEGRKSVTPRIEVRSSHWPCSDDTRVLVLEENGIFAIISAMIHHLLNVEMQARGAETLRELSKHGTSIQLLQLTGVLRPHALVFGRDQMIQGRS